jgi:hypothetical protein
MRRSLVFAIHSWNPVGNPIFLGQTILQRVLPRAADRYREEYGFTQVLGDRLAAGR